MGFYFILLLEPYFIRTAQKKTSFEALPLKLQFANIKSGIDTN